MNPKQNCAVTYRQLLFIARKFYTSGYCSENDYPDAPEHCLPDMEDVKEVLVESFEKERENFRNDDLDRYRKFIEELKDKVPNQGCRIATDLNSKFPILSIRNDSFEIHFAAYFNNGNGNLMSSWDFHMSKDMTQAKDSLEEMQKISREQKIVIDVAQKVEEKIQEFLTT